MLAMSVFLSVVLSSLLVIVMLSQVKILIVLLVVALTLAVYWATLLGSQKYFFLVLSLFQVLPLVISLQLLLV